MEKFDRISPQKHDKQSILQFGRELYLKCSNTRHYSTSWGKHNTGNTMIIYESLKDMKLKRILKGNWGLGMRVIKSKG